MKTKEEATEQLEAMAFMIVGLLKKNNIALGVTQNKKLALIDNETGTAIEINSN